MVPLAHTLHFDGWTVTCRGLVLGSANHSLVDYGETLCFASSFSFLPLHRLFWVVAALMLQSHSSVAAHDSSQFQNSMSAASN